MIIRVAIVDDHPMVSGGLSAALGTIDDVAVVARGATIADARAILVRDDVDVVLLDVRLEDGLGLQALAARGPRDRPGVLVMSSFKTSQYVAASAKFGAAGFLIKTVPLRTLVQAIRAVAGGGSVFSQDQLQKGFVTFTPREREIVELATRGHTNKEIAVRLGLSPKTVESHLTEVYDRFRIAGGRVELSMRAAEEGWLEVEAPKAAPRS